MWHLVASLTLGRQLSYWFARQLKFKPKWANLKASLPWHLDYQASSHILCDFPIDFVLLAL